MTSDQIGPGASTGSESPIALRACTRTSTAFACPLPGVGTVQVVAAHVEVVEHVAARRVDAARSRSP